jgi:hypothetical protein
LKVQTKEELGNLYSNIFHVKNVWGDILLIMTGFCPKVYVLEGCGIFELLINILELSLKFPSFKKI